MGILSKLKWGKRLFEIVDRVAGTIGQGNGALSLTGLRNRFADVLAAEVRRGALDDLVVKTVRARGVIVDYVERG